ncbi:MAG: ROK family protein [Clostridia bacterium]|nr:ROK family protein [Clostridia bacterium]
MSLYLGLSVGTSEVKGLIIDENGKVFAENSLAVSRGENITECLVRLSEILVQGAKTVFSKISGVGVSCSGEVDGKALEKKLGVKVTLLHGANASALGEAKFGAGKDYSDCVYLDLSEEVSGGYVYGGKLFKGSEDVAFGHMVIERGGNLCKCGRRGCFGVYCSTRALKARTKWAMEEYTSSEMWKSCNHETADEKTAFGHMDSDRTAKEVVERYLKYLACGVGNLANLYRPQLIIIGGEMAAQGSRLTKPLKEAVTKEVYGNYPVEIASAKLGARAAVLGAAAAAME